MASTQTWDEVQHRPHPPSLVELEVYETLQVGGDELADDEDRQEQDLYHHGREAHPLADLHRQVKESHRMGTMVA